MLKSNSYQSMIIFTYIWKSEKKTAKVNNFSEEVLNNLFNNKSFICAHTLTLIDFHAFTRFVNGTQLNDKVLAMGLK